MSKPECALTIVCRQIQQRGELSVVRRPDPPHSGAFLPAVGQARRRLTAPDGQQEGEATIRPDTRHLFEANTVWPGMKRG
ncbi:hypothetical protein [Intestinirhabdus alba]|uniref:Uncharacterized protein n=1 Tax=Intestinirhabdus alba TaxID=2899544 RepID=A0A6L6IQ37_9ENTR|nr:hypothetical protein [Intestinirhabdus alba]MTH48054.1 hypothetical protein [Intestinirhabdus alba]